MNRISEGFSGRQASARADLPPGQYLTHGFPVLSAGPTPDVPQAAWEFAITTGSGEQHRWDFDGLLAAGAEDIEVDLHCVTGWSKFGMAWRGVRVDTLMEQVGDTGAEQVLAHSYGGYTTNMPLEDLLDGQAWLAFEYDGEPLAPEHGGPVRLLIPHLYLWKSAKWLRELALSDEETPGFWEGLGYHLYGDPWQEQRYWGD